MTTNLYLLHLTGASLKKRLLEYYFTHPLASHYLREISVLLKMDPANLSRELKKLEKEGIFVSRKQGNQKYFSLNQTYPLYEELKSILLKTIELKEQSSESLKPAGLRNKASVYVIAGPNGAGKTTFAKKFLPEYLKCRQFVNADLIAGGLDPFAPERAALAAGKLLIGKIRDLSEKGINFGFETTLSGKSYVLLLKKLRDKGYAVHLFFLWIPTLELALARIQDRVKRGGHDIPQEVVKRRFHKGIRHLFTLYRPLLDSWTLFDNSDPSPHLIAAEENRILKVIDKPLFDKIHKIAEDA